MAAVCSRSGAVRAPRGAFAGLAAAFGRPGPRRPPSTRRALATYPARASRSFTALPSLRSISYDAPSRANETDPDASDPSRSSTRVTVVMVAMLVPPRKPSFSPKAQGSAYLRTFPPYSVIAAERVATRGVHSRPRQSPVDGANGDRGANGTVTCVD